MGAKDLFSLLLDIIGAIVDPRLSQLINPTYFDYAARLLLIALFWAATLGLIIISGSFLKSNEMPSDLLIVPAIICIVISIQMTQIIFRGPKLTEPERWLRWERPPFVAPVRLHQCEVFFVQRGRTCRYRSFDRAGSGSSAQR